MNRINFDSKYPGHVTFAMMGGFGHDYADGIQLQEKKLVAIQATVDSVVSYDVDCRTGGVVLSHASVNMAAGDIIYGFLQNLVVTSGQIRGYFQDGEATSP